MKKLIFTFSLLLSFHSIACQYRLPGLPVPPQCRKPVDQESKGISKELFEKILAKIDRIYAPIFAARFNSELVIINDWDFNDERTGRPKINAHPEREGDKWIIRFYGGYPKNKYATYDGMALLACHEIGHHIGFTFYYPKEKDKWISAEGQADYFATTKCLRKFYADEDNEAALEKKKVPGTVQEKCAEMWSDRKDQLICMRSSIAGYELTSIHTNGPSAANFDRTDSFVTTSTKYRHPVDQQCRIDTYFAGALCTVSHEIPFVEGDSREGSCHQDNGHTVGLRPRCWYSPDDN